MTSPPAATRNPKQQSGRDPAPVRREYPWPAPAGNDERFAEEHAPGSRWMTASRAPALVLPPEDRPGWMPSPLALALHMLGREPLPKPGAIVKRGKRLEPIGLDMLEEHGVRLLARQPRLQHARLQMLAYPDAQADYQGGKAGVELKVVERSDYDAHWSGQAPLYPRIQAGAQMACAEDCDVTLIVPLVIGFKYLELGEIVEEPRLPGLIDLMEGRVADFLAMLAEDRLPEPDLSESAYRTLQKLVPLEPGKTVHVGGNEATERLHRWRNARATRLAAEKEEKACQHYFATVAEDATKITVDGSDKPVKRSLVRETTVPEHTKSAYWRWSV